MAPISFVLLSAVLALSLSLASSALPSTPVFRNGSRSLPLTQGWLGADASFTIELSPNRYLWLFDDTLVASDMNNTDRRSAYWIHNTAGIMTCSDGGELTDCSITYYWSDAERKSEFWLTGHERDKQPQFYWVSDCFIHNSTLFVFLNTVENVPWGLGFQVLSSGIVSVDNYHDDPPQWRKRYQLIANTNVSIAGQTAILSTGPGGNPFPADPDGAAYLYSHMYISSHRFSLTALVRVPLHRLHDLAFAAGHWQYLATNLSFVPYRSDPTLPPPDVQHFWPVIGTVRWHAAYKQWINVSPSPDCYFGGAPVYSVSDRLETGWSEYSLLYQTPETNKSDARYNADAWCYAVFEHPELERQSDHLIFTYVCNARTYDILLRNNSLYEAQLVRMPYPGRQRVSSGIAEADSVLSTTIIPSALRAELS